jgi:hypothetical protein
MYRKTHERRLVAGTLVLIACAALAAAEGTPGRLGFWDQPRRGGNFFEAVPTRERFRAAREAGISWVRLVPDKWTAARHDFLLGDADDFRGVEPRDVARLLEVLGWADAEGVPVVLGMLSLPGCRWVQRNDGKEDYRLWREPRYQEQAAAFWRELASRLRGHPALVGYDPLNEPHPERADGLDGADAPGFPDWLAARRGSPADLDLFHARIARAIREVDPDTPILVEGYGHGSAAGLARLAPSEAPGMLYSFHFYEPWPFTAHRVNQGRYAYPDRMPAEWDGPTEGWTRRDLAARMAPAARWAERNGIARRRIVAAEFGCDRRVAGADRYLKDVIASLEDQGWHWAFYAFREDTWDGMDYELGTGSPPPGYRGAVERGQDPRRPRRANPLWRVIQEGLAAGLGGFDPAR